MSYKVRLISGSSQHQTVLVTGGSGLVDFGVTWTWDRMKREELEMEDGVCQQKGYKLVKLSKLWLRWER